MYSILQKVCFSLALSLSTSMYAQQSTLRVVTEEFLPYQSVDSNNMPTGLSVKLVNMILKKAQLNADIEMLPWARAYKTAQREKNVLIFSIAKTKQRLEKFDWIGPLFQLGKSSFVTLKSRVDINARNYEELKKYRVCSELDGWAYQHLLKKGFQEEINLFNLRGTLSFLKN